MKSLILACIIVLCALTAAYPASFTISWTASTSPDVLGYKVYVGTSSGTYTWSVDAGLFNNATIDDLNAGQTYYFAVAAYDYFGNESAKSAEVRATTPRHGLSINLGL